jgi:hypothetical protein
VATVTSGHVRAYWLGRGDLGVRARTPTHVAAVALAQPLHVTAQSPYLDPAFRVMVCYFLKVHRMGRTCCLVCLSARLAQKVLNGFGGNLVFEVYAESCRANFIFACFGSILSACCKELKSKFV